MTSALLIPLILVSVFATSILSGVLGMAGGMVLMGVLVWLLPVTTAMTLHATTQFFANASRALFHRKHIHTTVMGYYLAGSALVFAFFSVFIFVPDKATVFTLLGVTPFLVFLLPKNRKLDFTKKSHAFICGMTVLGFQLTGGVSGPLLDSFFQHTHLTRHQTVATKAATQALSHFLRFIYYSFVAKIALATPAGETAVPIWLYAAVIPTAILGTHASKTILEKLSDHQFFRATQIALLGIGSIYLFKAVALWAEKLL